MSLDVLGRLLATALTRIAVAIPALPGDGAATPPRTLAQEQVLLLLARRGPRNALRALAGELGLPVPAAITAVAGLQREGLVSMEPDPSYSPGEVSVGLTVAGAAQAPPVRHWAADLLAAIDELDPTEQRRLLTVARRQIRLMQQHGHIPVTQMCVTCRFFDPYAHPGTGSPHHCRLVDAPFGHRELRLRCPEHEAGDLPVEKGGSGR